jgi:hypothetical protein
MALTVAGTRVPPSYGASLRGRKNTGSDQQNALTSLVHLGMLWIAMKSAKVFIEDFHKLIFFVLVCGQMKPGRAQGRIFDIFNLVELYAMKIVSMIVFLVFLYVAARYEITHLLPRWWTLLVEWAGSYLWSNIRWGSKLW